ncbi:hypothetical protein ACFOVU_21905 [Nocardiopsis sediminis]|uniref:Uncharacterized protein n=1 Tax=Nocardiopsis sediminis TaxID=1778267 RepID=A0ABV8FV90_9ACTN
MEDLGAILLLALGGILAGGTYSMWKVNVYIAVALALCAVLAVAGGVLRLGYLPL